MVWEWRGSYTGRSYTGGSTVNDIVCVFQDEVKMKKVRRAYEDAVNDYGKTDAGTVW